MPAPLSRQPSCSRGCGHEEHTYSECDWCPCPPHLPNGIYRRSSVMIPTPGRIVEYTLTQADVDFINARRGVGPATTSFANGQGGNSVSAGESYPMIIVRAWGKTEGAAVNGKVLLDGFDNYWATSRVEGPDAGQWRPYARV